MQRLIRYLKHIKRFPKEEIESITSQLKLIQLLPGETLPEKIPHHSWIFVEQGLLRLERTDPDGTTPIVDFIFEGHSFTIYRGSESPGEDFFVNIKEVAIESSTLYHMLPGIFNNPNLIRSSTVLLGMNLRKSFAKQYKIHPQKRRNREKGIAILLKKYPSIHRIPLNQLDNYLQTIDKNFYG